MLKRILSITGQLFVMVLAAFAGMLFLGKLVPGLHVVHVISQQGFTRRQYEFDWLLSVGFVAVLFLLLGLISPKSRRTAWLSTVIAFAITVALLALFTHIGYKDVNLLYGN